MVHNGFLVEKTKQHFAINFFQDGIGIIQVIVFDIEKECFGNCCIYQFDAQ